MMRIYCRHGAHHIKRQCIKDLLQTAVVLDHPVLLHAALSAVIHTLQESIHVPTQPPATSIKSTTKKAKTKQTTSNHVDDTLPNAMAIIQQSTAKMAKKSIDLLMEMMPVRALCEAAATSRNASVLELVESMGVLAAQGLYASLTSNNVASANETSSKMRHHRTTPTTDFGSIRDMNTQLLCLCLQSLAVNGFIHDAHTLHQAITPLVSPVLKTLRTSSSSSSSSSSYHGQHDRKDRNSLSFTSKRDSVDDLAPMMVDILLAHATREQAGVVWETIVKELLHVMTSLPSSSSSSSAAASSSSSAAQSWQLQPLLLPSISLLTYTPLVGIYRRACSYYCSLSFTSDSDNHNVPLEFGNHASSVHELLQLLSSRVQQYACPLSCFLLADTLRVLAKYATSTMAYEELIKGGLSLPPLTGISSDISTSISTHVSSWSLEGWFLLTGTMLHLQRRAGMLLKAPGALTLIAITHRALVLVSSLEPNEQSSREGFGWGSMEGLGVDDGLLAAISVCMYGLVECIPYSVHEVFVAMMDDLSDRLLVGGQGNALKGCVIDGSRARLAQCVLVAAENAVMHGPGVGKGNSGGGGLIAMARNVLSRVAVASADEHVLGRGTQVQLSILACLQRGIGAVQSRQVKASKKRRGEDMVDGSAQVKGLGSGQNDDLDRERDSLGQWASTCLNVLAILVPRLLRGETLEEGDNPFQNTGETKFSSSSSTQLTGAPCIASKEGWEDVAYRAQVGGSALALIEQLCVCDSPGGSSLPLLGTAVGTFGNLLSAAILVLLNAEDDCVRIMATANAQAAVVTSSTLSSGGKTKGIVGSKRTVNGEFITKSSASHVTATVPNPMVMVMIENGLRAGGRALTACAGSKELQRHAHVLAATVRMHPLRLLLTNRVLTRL